MNRVSDHLNFFLGIIIPFLVFHLLASLAHAGSYVYANNYPGLGLHVLALDILQGNLNRDFLFGAAFSVLLYAAAIVARALSGGRLPVLPYVYAMQLCMLASRIPFRDEWPLPPAKEIFGGDVAVPIFLHIKYLKWMLPAMAVVFVLVTAVLLVSKGSWLRDRLAVPARLNRTGFVFIVLALVSVNAASRLIDRPLALQPHNVIWISWDSVRADHLSTYGYRRPTSPSLDRFALDALVYESAYAQHNWTAPSYASMFASRHVWEMPDWATSQARLTVTEVLKNYGYRTFGYVQNANLSREFQFDQGFDVYLERDGGLTPDKMSELALRRMRKQSGSDEPFFLFLHILEPHWPYRHDNSYIDEFVTGGAGMLSEEEVRDIMINNGSDWDAGQPDAAQQVSYMLDMYDATLRNTDDSLGQIMALLRELDLWDNSLVIFNSDHGDEFHERGAFGHAHHNVYPELTYVPLLIHYPATSGIAAGRNEMPVQQLDIYPTILDVLAIPQPVALSGESLLSTNREHGAGRIALSTFQGSLAVRSQQQSVVANIDAGERPQYFDRQSDRLELLPLAEPPDMIDYRLLQDTMLQFAGTREARKLSGQGDQLEHEDISEELRKRLEALGYIQ